MNINQFKKYGGKSLRLKNWDYSSAAYYFITICTKGRMPMFGSISDGKLLPSPAAIIVENHWKNLSNHFHCRLDEFVIMPDHIHGIIFLLPIVDAIHVDPIHELDLPQSGMNLPSSLDIPTNHQWRTQRRQMTLPKMIGRFKMQTAKGINIMYGTPGRVIWQSDYYERIIRSEQELAIVRRYIINNPRNWQNR